MTADANNPLTPVTLVTGNVTLSGFSRAGLATWLDVPEFDCLFDLGVCPISTLPRRHVFLTHAHADHASGLLRHSALRDMMGMKGQTQYYVPSVLESRIADWVHAQAALEDIPIHQFAAPQIVGVNPGDRVALNTSGSRSVVAFDVDHRVSSLGYTVYSTVKSLKAEYVGLPGIELGQLRRAGFSLEDHSEEASFTFIGDSSSVTLHRETHIWQSKALVLEATYLGQSDRDRARAGGHTHLDEIAEALEQHGDGSSVEHFVLKHFSLKYSDAQIRDEVKRVIPMRFLPRVQLLIGP